MTRAPDPGFTGGILDVAYTGRRLDYRTGWFVTGISGLTDGASVAPQEQERDRAEGQYDLPNRLRDPRIITIKGIVYAGSAVELERMQWQQGALLAMPESAAELHWKTRTGTRLSAYVRRGRGWEFTLSPSPRRATFLHRFRAPSQRVYGDQAEPVVGANVVVENRGSAPTPSVITVTGAMPNGYSIRGPWGRVYDVAAGINAGSRDVIDLSTGLLTRDGALAAGVYGPRIDVWEIPPGRTPLELVPVTGTGEMSVSLRPAYF
ncbi:hypothetical protein [Microbacterium testaceum]|nr:hypothetical protein [Microbacterium testaceum]